MAWTSPKVLTLFALGFLSLIAFIFIEQRVAKPMLDLNLFRIPGFAYGNIANLASAHRARRAAVHADRLAAGHLAAAARLLLRGDAALVGDLHAAADGRLPASPGRSSGYFSDRIGGVPFAVGGMVLGAASFIALMALPADFSYIAVRRAAVPQRPRLRPVRGAELRRRS